MPGGEERPRPKENAVKQRIKTATGLVTDAVVLGVQLYRELALSALRILPGRS
jgi:hypothetical protein